MSTIEIKGDDGFEGVAKITDDKIDFEISSDRKYKVKIRKDKISAVVSQAGAIPALTYKAPTNKEELEQRIHDYAYQTKPMVEILADVLQEVANDMRNSKVLSNNPDMNATVALQATNIENAGLILRGARVLSQPKVETAEESEELDKIMETASASSIA